MQMMVMLPVMLYARKLDAEDPAIVLALRTSYGLTLALTVAVTLYIQSDAQGTATSFRQPDSIGGTRYEDE